MRDNREEEPGSFFLLLCPLHQLAEPRLFVHSVLSLFQRRFTHCALVGSFRIVSPSRNLKLKPETESVLWSRVGWRHTLCRQIAADKWPTSAQRRFPVDWRPLSLLVWIISNGPTRRRMHYFCSSFVPLRMLQRSVDSSRNEKRRASV